MDGVFQQAQPPGELRQVFAVAHFNPYGEDSPVKVVRGVVHLEVGDVGVGVGDVAGDVGEQARVFVGFDFQRRRKEGLCVLAPRWR